MRYIIVGNSPHKTFSSLYQYQEGDYLIGLDVGSKQIINSGFSLNEAWGDFDQFRELDEIKRHTIKFNIFPEKKNETDLELILQNLNSKNVIDDIYLYDVTGGRLDHELVNMLLLQKYHQLKIKIIDEYNEICYLNKKQTYSFTSSTYQYVGLICFDNATISIEEAEYILPKVEITKNDTFTTSNQFINNKFTFTLYNGGVFIIKSK